MAKKGLGIGGDMSLDEISLYEKFFRESPTNVAQLINMVIGVTDKYRLKPFPLKVTTGHDGHPAKLLIRRLEAPEIKNDFRDIILDLMGSFAGINMEDLLNPKKVDLLDFSGWLNLWNNNNQSRQNQKKQRIFIFSENIPLCRIINIKLRWRGNEQEELALEPVHGRRKMDFTFEGVDVFAYWQMPEGAYSERSLQFLTRNKLNNIARLVNLDLLRFNTEQGVGKFWEEVIRTRESFHQPQWKKGP